jgi:hypothetical protein
MYRARELRDCIEELVCTMRYQEELLEYQDLFHTRVLLNGVEGVGWGWWIERRQIALRNVFEVEISRRFT